MTPDDGKLLTKFVYSGTIPVKLGNGHLLPIKHVDHSVITTPVKPLRLSLTLHVPQLSHNLLSVRQLGRDNNCYVVFDSNSNFFFFKDKTTGEVLLQALSIGNVYLVSLPAKSLAVPTNLASVHREITGITV